jgi:predicted nucleic acid-binding Zn ribbon protein
MDNLSELKAIWQTAKTDSLPHSDEMVRIIRKFRNKKLLKIGAMVFMAIVLVLLMVWVVFVYKSTMLSTRIGEAFIIIAGIILIATNINSLIRFYKLTDCSNKDFIKFLELTQKRQLFYYQKTQVVAMAFCASGLLFYIYEGVYKNTALFIGGYALLMAYLLGVWLFLRPRVFMRQAKKINDEIERVKAISAQIE